MNIIRHRVKPSVELILSLFFTAAISIGYFIAESGGFLIVRSDFNCQQLTFATAIQEFLSQASKGEWYWGLDLGSSLINGFSFYNLGSIFFWIVFLLPKGTFPFVCGFIYILKYVVAGVTAYYYLSLFVDNKHYAVIGAVTYAFSGFQTINLMFFHFHDVVAWFPLLLFALEMSMRERDNGYYRLLFIMAVFINCITNYFFFVQEVVFLIIYFLFRYWGTSKELLCKEIIRFLIYGIVGVGMASIIFFPSILYILGNSRSSADLTLSSIIDCKSGILYILKGMLYPAEPMVAISALRTEEYNSTSCYLPLFGMSTVISYILYEKGWLKKLLLFLLIISFSPLLQSSFLFFTATYQRWWYMLVLLLSLATIIALEKHKGERLNKSVIYYAVFVTLFYLGLSILDVVYSPNVITSPRRFTLYFLISVAGAVCLGLLNLKKRGIQTILAVTIAFSVLTTSVTMYFYRVGVDYNEIKQSYFTGLDIPPMDDQYRYNTAYNYYTLENNIPGIGVFSSTIENSSRAFDEMFEISKAWTSQLRTTVYGLPELLSGKYTLCTSADGIEIDCTAANINSYKVCRSMEKNTVERFTAKGVEYSIVEEKACPIGFSLNNYILKDDLMDLPINQRATTLMQAAVLDKTDEYKVDGFATRTSTHELIDNDIYSLIDTTVENSVEDFHRDSKGFSCKTSYPDNRLVYWTVPDDDGWTAIIDGKETEIIDSGGMMLLKVPAGNHTVIFKYHTPGFKTGIIMSIFFWCIFIIYSCIVVCRNRRNVI